MGNISDVVSAEEVLRGIITMSPRSVITGAALKTWQTMVKHLRDPNRAVRKIFEEAERLHGDAPQAPPIPPSGSTGGMQPPRSTGPGQNAAGGTSTGVASGGQAREAMGMNPGYGIRPKPLTDDFLTIPGGGSAR